MRRVRAIRSGSPWGKLDEMLSTNRTESPPDVTGMDAEARTSQRQRDYARSIPLWDKLCGLCPGSWEYPLALALDLGSAGRRAEADEIFRRGVKTHPDSLWLLFHWSMLAFSEGRLDIAEQRARKLLDRFGTERACLELLGDIAVQQRDMWSAVRHFETACTLEPSNTTCAEKLSYARTYHRLAQQFPAVPTRLNSFQSQADYAVLVINLDHNPERLLATERAFADSPAPLYRIPGVRGSYLAAASCLRLTGTGVFKKGTLGTFLAHVAAWEVAAELEFDCCLIIEDDASPIIDLPIRIAALALPDGFDLCFVNERMQCRVESYDSLPHEFQVRNPLEALEDWSKDMNAPGADGYLLSRAGARKLLTFVAQEGFAGDVDWRLVRYGIPAGGQASLPADSIAFDVLQKMEAGFRGRLEAYTLFPCLIRASTHDSVRSAENEMPSISAQRSN